MYTLLLKYTIDPNKLDDWHAYAKVEFQPITGTMAEYEVYRCATVLPRLRRNACRPAARRRPPRYGVCSEPGQDPPSLPSNAPADYRAFRARAPFRAAGLGRCFAM
jgi:hypothetical protein